MRCQLLCCSQRQKWKIPNLILFEETDTYTDCESQICLLNAFEPATETEIGILLKLSPVKSYKLDPIPTWLLRDCAHDIIPILTNMSLRTGVMPSHLKRAHVRRILKKPGLDKDTLNNYRPVSNLPYLSKTIGRVVAARLSAHMSECNLCVPNQSAYKPNHSVETALVCVQNDILCAMDNQNIVIMLLLDLSAAFDTVDHNVMLHRLSHDVGVGQTALKWFKSYLSDRVQAAHINGSTSPARLLTCGVPQGSVLGPQLFSIYAAPLSKIIRNNNLMSHFYADDTQIYITVKPHQEDIDAAVESIEQCVTEIRIWMKTNSLKLNVSKTEVIVYGSAQQLMKITLQA